ncbi:hypothetical protein PVAG01_06556 [Phlyctema vagabunda]|uniref:Uncharacterized protein n=1 Tax=Phlyctema vagabunda TaxID=108571 RepID=A0ABR4PGI3_9HELO
MQSAPMKAPDHVAGSQLQPLADPASQTPDCPPQSLQGPSTSPHTLAQLQPKLKPDSHTPCLVTGLLRPSQLLQGLLRPLQFSFAQDTEVGQGNVFGEIVEEVVELVDEEEVVVVDDDVDNKVEEVGVRDEADAAVVVVAYFSHLNSKAERSHSSTYLLLPESLLDLLANEPPTPPPTAPPTTTKHKTPSTIQNVFGLIPKYLFSEFSTTSRPSMPPAK